MTTDISTQVTAMHDAVYDLLLSNINHSPSDGRAVNARVVMDKCMDDLCCYVPPLKAMKMLHNVVKSFEDEAFCVMAYSSFGNTPVTSDQTKKIAIEQRNRLQSTFLAHMGTATYEVVVF